MKIQLDTKNKVITIEESVNLGKFIKTISKMLPDGEWKKFKLEAVKKIKDWSPSKTIIIDRRHDWTWRYPGWWYAYTSETNPYSITYTNKSINTVDNSNTLVTNGDISEFGNTSSNTALMNELSSYVVATTDGDSGTMKFNSNGIKLDTKPQLMAGTFCVEIK